MNALFQYFKETFDDESPAPLCCDHCGRVLVPAYTAECDFDYEMAEKAGYPPKFLWSQDMLNQINHANLDLAPFMYTMDAGYCDECEELSIHFDGTRYYFDPATGKFPIQEDI